MTLNRLLCTLTQLVLIAVVAGSCKDKPTTPTIIYPNVIKGYGASPVGFPITYNAAAAFYSEVGSLPRGGVLINTGWRDSLYTGFDAGEIPHGAVGIFGNAPIYGYTPIAVFGFRADTAAIIRVPADSTNNWSNLSARALFYSMIRQFVSTYKPPLLFLGNENDFYYTGHQSDYANWLTVYNAAYDTIKHYSAATQVGPVFNCEHLAGLGALNGWTTSHWPAIEDHDFSRIDIVALTLYPFLSYAAPSSVPATYLDSLRVHLNGKPVAITETGWPAENLGGLDPLWQTSDSAQIAYVNRLDSILVGLDVRVLNWLFLNGMVDPGGSPTYWKQFGSISIRNATGAKRLCYDKWASYFPE